MSHAKRRMDRDIERKKWGWRGGRFEQIVAGKRNESRKEVVEENKWSTEK